MFLNWRVKSRPNDSNISVQHIPTMLALHLQALAKQSQHLNATDRNIVERNMLCVFGHPVAKCRTCCELKIELVRMPGRNIVALTWPIFKFEPTTPNMSQQGGQMHATYCTQQCCDMLRKSIAVNVQLVGGLLYGTDRDARWKF